MINDPWGLGCTKCGAPTFSQTKDVCNRHGERPLPMPKTVTHIASGPVQIGTRIRQCCSWCGVQLESYDLKMWTPPPGAGAHQKPHTWPTGALVAVMNGAAWQIADRLDGAVLPETACFNKLDVSDFDRFCEENQVPVGGEPSAFAAWLRERSDGAWDGVMSEVQSAKADVADVTQEQLARVLYALESYTDDIAAIGSIGEESDEEDLIVLTTVADVDAWLQSLRAGSSLTNELRDFVNEEDDDDDNG